MVWVIFGVLILFSIGVIPVSVAQEESELGIKVGYIIEDIAVNPETNTIYAMTRGGFVYVIDGSSYEILDRIHPQGGDMSLSIAVNPTTNLVYVGQSLPEGYDSVVDVIDGNTYKVIDSIPVQEHARDIVIDQERNILYVANFWSDSVSVIDANTNKVIKTIGVGKNPTSLAINQNTNTVYVANSNGGRGNPHDERLFVIDGYSLEVSDIISVAYRLQSVAVNPNTNLVYVVNWGSYTDNYDSYVSVLDGSTNEIVDTIDVGQKGSHLEINPVTNLLYVLSFGDKKEIQVIDGYSNEIVSRINLGNEIPEDGLAINPVENKIFAATKSRLVSVIDGSDHSIIPIENTPSLRYSPELDFIGKMIEQPIVQVSLIITFAIVDLVGGLVLLGIILGVNRNSSRFEKPVNVYLQMLLSALFILWIYAFYRIKKLRKGILLVMLLQVTMGIISTLAFSETEAIIFNFVAVIPPIVLIMRKWSKEWNESIQVSA